MGLGPVFGHHPGGVAAFGDGHDGIGFQFLGDLHGSMADGIGHLHLGPDALVLEHLDIIDGFFRPFGDPGHGLHRFQRIGAGGRFPTEHDGVRAVKDGVGDVVGFGPGSPVVGDHAFQHLGGGDHRLAQHIAFGDDFLLDNGHVFHGDLHPQIAPGHHDPVHHLEDFVDVVHPFLVLDLGDDPHGGPQPFQEPADLHGVMGIPHERSGHISHAVLGGKGDIGNIRFGQEGQFQEGPRHSHPFPGGDFPAIHHFGPDFRCCGGFHFQG